MDAEFGDDFDEELIINDPKFDVADVSEHYSRTKAGNRVTAIYTDKSGKEISEFKLYLILERECRRLERRLGITEAADSNS